jgi:hypothetical protein
VYDAFWTECYDTDDKPMDLRLLPKAWRGCMKIKLTSVYTMSKDSWGFTWEAVWVKVVDHYLDMDFGPPGLQLIPWAPVEYKRRPKKNVKRAIKN